MLADEWRISKLQHYWERPEYWEESWRFEETCCHSNSSESLSALTDAKNFNEWIIIIIIIIWKCWIDDHFRYLQSSQSSSHQILKRKSSNKIINLIYHIVWMQIKNGASLQILLLNSQLYRQIWTNITTKP